MTTTRKPRPIADLDVALPVLQRQIGREQVNASVRRLRWLLAHPAPGRPATVGELAEQRHLLHDADPDSTVPPLCADLTKPKRQEAS